ncbi:DNA translocase FtsK [Rhizobiaceae bacterium CRRU44]|uniref:DNA translocase FtsK n=1 Tax=Ferranicluibacter rubi TaxID=2715133 RepID=A0AA44CAQ3_9HYPH|nr:DNA translocase FtsK [Ferranicluibacter rubi]
MRLSRTNLPHGIDNAKAEDAQQRIEPVKRIYGTPETLGSAFLSGADTENADEMAAGEIEGRAPIWQSNFVIGPNVRFTRTPDSAYPKRSPKSPPMLEMVQINEHPPASISDMTEATASMERPEMTQTFDMPETDFATARGALALALKLRREFPQSDAWPQLAQIEAPRDVQPTEIVDVVSVEPETVIEDVAVPAEAPAPVTLAPRAFSFAINDAIFFETLLSNPDFDPSLSLIPAPSIRETASVKTEAETMAIPVVAETPAPVPPTIAFRTSPESVTALYRVIEVGPAKAVAVSGIDETAPVETATEEPQAAPEPVAEAPAAPEVAEEAPAAFKPRIRAAQVLAGRLTPSLQLSAAARAIDLSVLPEMEGYQLPSVELLQEPVFQQTTSMSQEALEQSAGLLESVLEDFGVRGEIIDVRPGPVVTLYEFEPAPGVKSSRVIGLSDDIARSMSALSARVAVVPGRNVIGIELPNPVRETVYFREMIESHSYEETKFKLPLCLGKTIGGEPVVAELAKMPHLLVAGTTGSGKSVAINTMILSLLYRLKPEECRLIMVDPKMLELSIYDGIPHLLTPVVTDPKKAVMALKWAVREMEDRYRKMSRLGVRNIDGYNGRAAIARAKGETVFTTVQTGFDRGSGEPVFEEQELDLAPMPYIVIIVDEMADLMMVAGKEIEGAIQRLAQMARAAGIHLIMATQRPSVDVITGTIKANFPTRISFQVTSKIDSRTILGEQGAEHLLGQGDMLHMVGGGRIARVHGPFVSDEEVEKVVNHLKAQGRPEYLGTVTEDADEVEEAPEEDTAVFDKSGMAEEDGQDLYDKAVKVVLRDKKCSTSYIQRRLQIGYNRAASLVERMEREGLVGAANHVGKRSIIAGGRDTMEPIAIEPAILESED